MDAKDLRFETRLAMAIQEFSLDNDLSMPTARKHTKIKDGVQMHVINIGKTEQGAPVIPIAVREEQKRLVGPVIVGYYTHSANPELAREFMTYLKEQYDIDSKVEIDNY
ncbi:hypothetical protein GF343_02900 [Candidatus Woesearchaeota archaeon]|nr:hypothetical protein [Candidatus Woesearchaeota archaeon]